MTRIRLHISVRGQVQGVGFRPFVYRLARELALGGCVGNDSHGAWIEVEGEAEALARFEERLRSESPPLAHIYEIRRVAVPPRSEDTFTIVRSRTDLEQDVGITPDAAVCADCLREMFDPADRRFRYPFINCTNCGPRYSIIRDVPYDRSNTTMSRFRMCLRCQREYDDPADRRFHAQPNACPVCGPRLWLVDAAGRPLEGDPITRAADMLREGRIVAIKGIGGFHLACRADQDAPVARLRRRKARETKPFAVMVPDLRTAHALGHVSPLAEKELTSHERPIVLVPKRMDGLSTLSRHVAPGTPCVGMMLPYAPVHFLLFAENLPALVMTSANPTDEPLTADNEEALERLKGLTDAFLMHDRDIARRVDDSVIIVSGSLAVPIRRARGYAPAAVLLDRPAPAPVLAVGGELKNTVCVYQGHDAILSEHMGDLKSPSTYRHFVATVEKLLALLRCRPECVAYDLHPAYLSTQYALRQHVLLQGVQHHHAHIASCMADNGTDGPVIGVACDGTGYGVDGAIWGCEIMVADRIGFRRVGHLRYFPLPGGDAAARMTFRPALGICRGEGDIPLPDVLLNRLDRVDPAERAAVLRMMQRRLNCPPTSSLGRLFDAVAFLLGLCWTNGHEAQAAMALEEQATGWLREHGIQPAPGDGPQPESAFPQIEPYPFDVACTEGMIELDWRPMVGAILAEIGDGRPADGIAARFHETLAHMLARAASLAADRADLRTVALSGGCFANQILLARTGRLIEREGLTVLTHRRVPPGDGGLALGQAVVAAARLERNA